ncbi:MAG TPA: ATP synthase subunit I [Bryobacteraceae bacterium]|nr:ATP synthase subunit I [Bryobacteraceae bacterium]
MKTDGIAVARRVYTMMFALAGMGLAAAWFFAGWPGFAGFFAGVAISFGNAWWMARLSMSIGSVERPSGSGPAALVAVFRYLLMLGILYVILSVSETGFLAALAGCFVHIVAVVLEVVYELTYGTS